MTEQTPPDWVLREAAKQAGWGEFRTVDYWRRSYGSNGSFRALCDMIAKHEQKPVDRKLLCAREAWDRWLHDRSHTDQITLCVLTIELWEEGFGK
jgi:hypothetical protein